MLRIKLNKSVNKKLFSELEKSSKRVSRAIDISLDRIGNDMRNRARELAPYKKGNLRRSITVQRTRRAVRVGTNLIYAAIHDLGGIIPAHTILPRNSDVLRFVRGGRVVYAKRVNQPARQQKKYKGRGYLTPAFNEMKKGKAQKIFGEEIESALDFD